jgi:ADP-ribosyl-[dinitrogen reductase] hydrolase
MDVRKREVMLRAFQSMAVADAFCYGFEFTHPTVHTVRKALQYEHPIGMTDDTQMALFGLLGLANAANEGVSQPEFIAAHYILPQYLAWYETQAKIKPGKFINWLADKPEMQASRAPGKTCLTSLRELYKTGQRQKNNSKGDGAVMRCLPFVFAPWILGISPLKAIDLALAAGRLTHDHDESSKAIKVFMYAGFQFLSQAITPAQAILNTEEAWGLHLGMPVAKLCGREDTFTALPAVKAALTAYKFCSDEDGMAGPVQSFQKMLVDCCANVGDSDTIAAMAGALWGLRDEPPVQFLERLKERDIISEVVSVIPLGEDGVPTAIQQDTEVRSQ